MEIKDNKIIININYNDNKELINVFPSITREFIGKFWKKAAYESDTHRNFYYNVEKDDRDDLSDYILSVYSYLKEKDITNIDIMLAVKNCSTKKEWDHARKVRSNRKDHIRSLKLRHDYLYHKINDLGISNGYMQSEYHALEYVLDKFYNKII